MVSITQYILALLLMGYALFGRAMAYMGFSPIYIGEIALVTGLLFILSHSEWKKLLKIGVFRWLLLFMFWGAVRTFPYISHYGKDALRDGVSWGYGLFAIIVATLMIRTEAQVKVIKWYRDTSVLYSIWIPLAIIFMLFLSDRIPYLPWGPNEGISAISLKGGDIAVHLSGMLAFYYLVLPNYPFRRFLLLFWYAWLFCFIFIGVTGRAAFLTVSTTAMVTVYKLGHEKWIQWVSLALLVVMILMFFEIEIDTGQERIVSFEQLITNVKSIFGEVEGFSGEGSKMWRIMWWQKIVDYTVFGEYFWTGKGFGINLADDDGFQVLAESALRSPHNGHLTFLARAGVPGFLLWIGLQLSFAASLWKSYRRLEKRGYAQDAGLYLWIFIYWLAFMINGTFDVFFEGPQGGIWFWALMGFGLGLVHAERQLSVQDDDPASLAIPFENPDR
jgi:hypothetical protein